MTYITFVCRSTKTKEGATAALSAQVRDKERGLDMLFSTPVKVTVAEWKKAHKRNASAKSVNNYRNSVEGIRVHEQLTTVKALIEDDVKEGVADWKVIKENIDSVLYLNDARKQKDEAKRLQTSCVLAYFDKFIEKMAKGEVKTSRKRNFDKSTQNYYKNTRRYFGEYTKENKDLTFNQLNNDIADGFINYMDMQHIMRSTQKNVLACFQAVCNRAWNSGLIEPSKVGVLDLWKMPTPNEDEVRAEVALTEDEVNAIWDLSCSGTLRGLDKLVIDMTLAGIYSMQRFSDYSRFSKDMVKEVEGRKFLHFIQDKTEVEVDVPLVGRLADIMARNDYDFTKLDPKTHEWVSKVNYQTFGKRLRKILHELSKDVPSLREMVVTNLTQKEIQMEGHFQDLLNRKAKKQVKTASKEYYTLLRDTKLQIENGCMGTKYLWKRNAHGEVIKEKWSLCNSHVCRRTGITLALEHGILTDSQIRKISGHKTLKAFRKYDKRDVNKINANIFDALARAEAPSKAIEIKMAQ